MRIYSLLLSLLGFLLYPIISEAQQQIDLIPKPWKMQTTVGSYPLAESPIIAASPEFMELATLYTEYQNSTKWKLKSVKKERQFPKKGIRLIKAMANETRDSNAYSLQIDASGVLLKAPTRQTAVEGLFTLIQLGLINTNKQELPFLQIVDKPNFAYRGMHLDPSRHFLPIPFIEKFIDVMAIYKFNNLHLHLTDAAGWRIEVKKYPALTQKAAWRSHVKWKDWWNNGRQYVEQGTANASGGFYTQQQAQALVAYAARKGINIIPEIEFPAHSEEVLAVYPALACSGHAYTQGEFCIGNPQTFEFMENVLEEMLAIFPSEYIHIGGDEADKRHWATCAKCQSLMQRKKLKNVDELQSYAIKQMDAYLQSKGRKLIGWDEILEGGLSSGATVMSWRGEQGGILAANAGHDVIMTPGSHLYFDSYQTDPRTQPETIGGYTPLEKVYSYYPIPESISADKKHHILGAQATLWAEYMNNYQQVEYMAFPRSLALSEVNWSPKESKNFEDFKRRLQTHYRLLQNLGINYYRPSYNVAYQVDYNAHKYSNTVHLSTEQMDASGIRYTLDGKKPTAQSIAYKAPFERTIPTKVQAAYFLDSVQVGPIVEIELDVHKAIGRRIHYNKPWSDNYPAQKEATLINGIKGGLTYQDQQWQGFLNDIDITIDFERREEISTVAMNFMQMTGPGVFMPAEFSVLISDNGRDFRPIGTVKNEVSDQDPSLIIKRFELNLPKSEPGRYLRIQAKNNKGGFLFADELIVY